MASGVNKVLLVGNLGNQPEVRKTNSGTSAANFNVAVNEKRKENDQWVDHVEWVSVSVFGKNAENAEKYLSKGSQVYVEGKLQTRKYTAKDGVERKATEVLCSNLIFLGGRSDSHGGGGGTSRSSNTGERGARQAQRAARASVENFDDDFIDDDLPF